MTSVSQKAFDLSEPMIKIATEMSSHLGCCASLHEHDQLIGYFINRMNMSPENAASDYITAGYHDAKRVSELIIKISSHKPMRILEFASGYGRVTRHLKRLLPEHDLFSSDIHLSACDFVRDSLGVVSYPSTTNVEVLDVGKNYDFIFALSFFSHMPDSKFGLWLTTLYDILAPGGYLMFTTHGQTAINKAPEFFNAFLDKDSGFGFSPESEQNDLDLQEYGTTVSLPSYVSKTILAMLPRANIFSFSSVPWFGLQDEWIIQKNI